MKLIKLKLKVKSKLKLPKKFERFLLDRQKDLLLMKTMVKTQMKVIIMEI
jgi:hypothetical protein